MLGSIVPAALVYFVYNMAFQSMNKSLVAQNLSMIEPDWFVPAMIASLSVLGVLIGALGSAISMRRFLKI